MQTPPAHAHSCTKLTLLCGLTASQWLLLMMTLRSSSPGDFPLAAAALWSPWEAEIPAAMSPPRGLTSNSCPSALLIRAPGSRLDVPLLLQLPATNTYPDPSASLFPFLQPSDISALHRDKYQTVESLGLPRNASWHSTNRAAIFFFLIPSFSLTFIPAIVVPRRINRAARR